MSAYFFCHLAIFLQDRVLVFGYQGFLLSFRKEAVCAEVVHFRLYARSRKLLAVERIAFYRIFVGESFVPVSWYRRL